MGAKKMNREIVDQEQHPLDRLHNSRSVVAKFVPEKLPHDRQWLERCSRNVETKWVEAPRLKRPSHSISQFIPNYERGRQRSQLVSKPKEFRRYAFFAFFADFGWELKAKMEVFDDDKSMNFMHLPIFGRRGGNRTHNPRLRRPVLYPVELLAHAL